MDELQQRRPAWIADRPQAASWSLGASVDHLFVVGVTRDEVLRHPGIVLNAPDGNRDLRDSLA